MTPPLPWIYEPCDPEGAHDDGGNPYPHAVRGRKPAGRLVTGYGYTEPAAYDDAREKATRYDAREVIGERGEVKMNTGIEVPPEIWDVCKRIADEGLIVRAKLGAMRARIIDQALKDIYE